MGGSDSKPSRVDVPAARGLRFIAAGAVVLAVQSALLFGGFLIYTAAPGSAAFDGSAAVVFLDLPGLALLAFGLLRVARAQTPSESGRDLVRLSAVLGLASLAAVVGWRAAIPARLGRPYADVLLALWNSDGGLPPELASHAAEVVVLLVLWLAASILLAASSYALRLSSGPIGRALLEPRVDLRSWEGFATLNAAGTVLVAGSMLLVVAGGVAGNLLLVGAVMKVSVVSLNGTFAYAFLAGRARRAPILREGSVGVPVVPNPSEGRNS